METLKVSSKSNPSKVAGAIANVFRSLSCVFAESSTHS